MTELMFEHFFCTLFLPLLFIGGWGMLYELFYRGAFLDNNYDFFGGIIGTIIALGCIYFPLQLTYLAFRAGVLFTIIADFFIIGFYTSLAVAFIWYVLSRIHKVVKKFEATNQN